MNTPPRSARCRLALALTCSLLAAAPPAQGEARVIFQSERSLVLRVRDLNGDRVRDVAYFFPDQRTQFDGPGRAEIQTQNGVILAQFRASGQHEVFALGANHPADIDDNQILNSHDLTLLVQRAGQQGAAGIPGDVNFDGLVNDADGAWLMTALHELDGLGWIRFDHRWPAAFEPNADERNSCPFFEEDPAFTACRPSGGDNPDGGDPDDTGPLGPEPGGGGGPGGPGPGGGDCTGVEAFVTPSSPSSHVTLIDGRPTALTFLATGSPPGGTATWSVSGAVIAQSDNSRCDVMVHEAGTVVVMATYEAPNGCAAEAALELPAYALDLSVDIDENGTVDDADIEAEAQAPGLILLANNFDEDGDGVEGFADGFDWNPLIEQDNGDDTTTFIPIKLRVGGVESGSARVRIDYPASDPMALTIGDDGWALPPGNLRLWKSDGSEFRSAELLVDGGDYIAPGEYTLADLGLFGSSEVTLYVESVRESQAEGDIVIAAAVKADEESGWVATDVVVGTGVRMQLLAQNYGGNHVYESHVLISTSLENGGDPSPPECTAGPWQVYSLAVLGPLSFSRAEIGGVNVPLQPQSQPASTTPFAVIAPPWPDNPAMPHSMPAVVIDAGLSNSFEVSIWVEDDAARASLPLRTVARFYKFAQLPDIRRTLGQHGRTIISEMKAINWTPSMTSYLPTAAFGIDFHNRLFTSLRASSDRWVSNVYVDRVTHRIVRIGTGPGPTGSLEIDLMKLKDGYNVNIGDVIDRNRVDVAVEVKTSVSGLVSDEKAALMDDVFGADEWHLFVPEERYSFADNGFVLHEYGKLWQATRLAGFSAMAGLMVQSYTQIAAADPLIEAYEDALLLNLDYYEREEAVLSFFEEFRTWMGHFDVEGTLSDATFLFNVYAYLRLDE